jgi:predicted protein tyrosine phosphatase
MNKLKILFVCGMNKKRSLTAHMIYKNDSRVEVRSAGVSPSSNTKLTEAHIEWADLILVMEKKYKERIMEIFKRRKKFPRVVSLDIPDEYEYMDNELVQIVKTSTEPYLCSKSY